MESTPEHYTEVVLGAIGLIPGLRNIVKASGLGNLGVIKSLFRNADEVESVVKTADKTQAVRAGVNGAESGFKTFNALKKQIGSAGQGNEWHHIV